MNFDGYYVITHLTISKKMKRSMHSRTLTISKLSKKTKTNNQKAAKTRRQRGYQWEDTLVKRFNASADWKAFRLGSPSIALPDVLAVNTENSTILLLRQNLEQVLHFQFHMIKLKDV